MADESSNIKAVGEFISALTPRSLVLGCICVFFALCFYSLYENRQAAFIYVLGSPYLLIGIGVGAVLFLAGWIISVQLNRVEEMFESRISDQTKTIDTMRKDLDICKNDCREANTGLLRQILEKLDAKS